MKKTLVAVLVLFSSVLALSIFYQDDEYEESIIFFPIDPSVVFEVADTTLSLVEEKDNDEYTLEWDVTSILNKEVFLRQDISLLYSNGRLKSSLSEWEDNSKKLAQYKKVSGEDSSHFIAVSYHHGEIHEGESIFSTQKMSSDELYVIDSSFSSLQSFRTPETAAEKEWKNVLDHVTKQQLTYTWEKLINHFSIDKEQYDCLPLTSLVLYNEEPLFNMDQSFSQKTIGQLWEGLYKNYFLGIKKEDGTVVEPSGSILPLILFSKDQTHIIVLTETINGYPVQLIQRLKAIE
ncbi:hypothetical protein LCL95_11935 [Bacillus timonensis]|nr:hypothetical protein [Bacillus timonensis]